MHLDVMGIPVEFVVFALTLLGIATLHNHSLLVAVSGLVVVSLYKVFFAGFGAETGFPALWVHLSHEWVTLINLLALILGFAILARHFEKSHLPIILPRFLPQGWPAQESKTASV